MLVVWRHKLSNDNELSTVQRAMILSLCRATSGGKGAHVPKPYFMNKPKFQGRKGEKVLRELVSLGYIIVHPTGGQTTYSLGERGLEICRKIRDELRMIGSRKPA